MSSAPLEQFSPAAEPLVQLVRQGVDDEQLQKMARCDYAQDVEEHLNALRRIKAGDIPAPMEWHPREVLELTRWTEPDNYPPEAESQKVRDHWIRLFACTILIHADVNPKNFEAYHWGDNETTIQLIESAVRLGTEALEAALQFLCWGLQQEQLYEDESWYFALAILWLATRLNRCDAATAEYLIAIAHNYGSTLSTLIKESQRKTKWTQLATDLDILRQSQTK